MAARRSPITRWQPSSAGVTERRAMRFCASSRADDDIFLGELLKCGSRLYGERLARASGCHDAENSPGKTTRHGHGKMALMSPVIEASHNCHLMRASGGAAACRLPAFFQECKHMKSRIFGRALLAA